MAASLNSENAVAGMTKLLREIDHHSSKLKALTITVSLLEEQQTQQIVQSKAVLQQILEASRFSPRLIAFGLLAFFAGGAVLGGFIVS
ncbi:hypothetical protein SAMN04488523_11914 [Sulfitobacter brevis]|uniref:Uncharacterized protein n=1 Tax=Sulfitobacter brevis TaxID=74348 RepID=A0A1I2G4T1_9RHOB|nr:hypothetical protein [Sulfitobacter brevis]SFF11631.1 hypothetical protein SAMN04488523_11914 [Sulfitobacter brevis]